MFSLAISLYMNGQGVALIYKNFRKKWKVGHYIHPCLSRVMHTLYNEYYINKLIIVRNLYIPERDNFSTKNKIAGPKCPLFSTVIMVSFILSLNCIAF